MKLCLSSLIGTGFEMNTVLNPRTTWLACEKENIFLYNRMLWNLMCKFLEKVLGIGWGLELNIQSEIYEFLCLLKQLEIKMKLSGKPGKVRVFCFGILGDTLVTVIAMWFNLSWHNCFHFCWMALKVTQIDEKKGSGWSLVGGTAPHMAYLNTSSRCTCVSSRPCLPQCNDWTRTILRVYIVTVCVSIFIFPLLRHPCLNFWEKLGKKYFLFKKKNIN